MAKKQKRKSATKSVSTKNSRKRKINPSLSAKKRRMKSGRASQNRSNQIGNGARFLNATEDAVENAAKKTGRIITKIADRVRSNDRAARTYRKVKRTLRTLRGHIPDRAILWTNQVRRLMKKLPVERAIELSTEVPVLRRFTTKYRHSETAAR
jgi:hypothetical protein